MLKFRKRETVIFLKNSEKEISKFHTDKRTEEAMTVAVKINVYHLGRPVG